MAEEILGDLLSAEPNVVEALVEELSNREEFDVLDGGDAFYGDVHLQHVRAEADEFIELWESFAERVKHKVRFFDSEPLSIRGCLQLSQLLHRDSVSSKCRNQLPQ